MPSHDTTEKSVAAQFLHTEVSRLGAQPGLRSLPPGPERDFLTLTWGPIVYRTTYAPESHRLLPLFLRALNEAIQTALHRLPGTREEIHLLEKTYASKVFSAQDQYQDVGEDVIRQIFHDWKVSLALPSIELPVRLRLCLIVDDAVLASFAKQVDLAAKEGQDAHTSGCPIKVLEENFPDSHRRDSNPAVGSFPGWTTVALSSLVEVYDGLREGKGLMKYHSPGSVYMGGGDWKAESEAF
jgi:hypothetical protein